MSSYNKYTSPRVYLSKGYASKRKVKTQSHFEMGIGYVVPEGMTKSEFKSEYAKWEQKLQNSGFIDIESRSPSQSGYFTPFFRENGSTATFQLLYDPSKEEYYSLCRDFDAYMDSRVWFTSSEGLKVYRTRWSFHFGEKQLTYKTLWYLHSEGLPYRAVAAMFSNQKTKYARNVKKVPKSVQRSCSEFWTHDHTHKILDLFWAWIKSTKGLDDPRHSDEV